MTAAKAIDLFIEEARAVTVVEAAAKLGIRHKGDVPITTRNYAGPCPACGGNDRFSINPRLGAFNCRQCGGKGRDGISLMALANGHNLSTRSGFLEACADALGQPTPENAERETEEERQERLERIEQRRRDNEGRSREAEKSENRWREREINQARGIYLHAPERPISSILGEYLRRRTGYEMHEAVFANLRLAPNLSYWEGQDDRGNPLCIYSGPAQVAPFVNLDGRIIGCHQTWIDLRNGPKFRADLGLDEKGKPLPSKKMRGTKKGGLIPLFGLLTSRRWAGGEGIENGLAIAGAEDFRVDTFYFAAGDIGNLAGQADPKSAFPHPHETYQDKAGRIRAVRVQGPVPHPDQGEDDAMQVPDHVEELILIADGDSEPVFTASCMARAETRLSREGRSVETWWPPHGMDFSKLMAG